MSLSPRLSRRSHQGTLPAFTGVPSFVDTLVAEAGLGAWRIIEVMSGNAGPFELHLSWSSGDGAGQELRLTVARGTRLSLYAASLKIRAANLAPRDNRVTVTVSDGYCVSDNVYELRLEGTGEVQTVDLPPFARAVRLDVASSEVLPACRLKLLDGSGVARAEVLGDAQPEGGLLLGGAGGLRVIVPSKVSFRLIFTLSL